jgi:hypothetical protein
LLLSGRAQLFKPTAKVLRTLITLAAGVMIGLLIGLAVVPRLHPSGDHAVAAKSLTAEGMQTPTPVTQQSLGEHTYLVLGNITTVPFQELYGILATKSPAEISDVARQLRDMPPGPDTDAKITAFFKAWAHLHAKASFESALTMKTKTAKAAAIRAVIDGADVPAAGILAKLVSELPTDTFNQDERDFFLGSVLSNWGQSDPVAAARFVDESLPRGASMNLAQGYNAIATTWARTDPQAALAWADAHASGFGAQFVKSGALTGWWQKGPGAAEQYVASRTNTPEGRQEAGNLASMMFSSNPQHAKEWISNLSDAEARRQACVLIALQAAGSDPAGAANWAASLPEDVRGASMDLALNRWLMEDPESAGKWVDAQSGAVRDVAVAIYSNGIAAKEPARAATWAMSIGDPTQREKSVERVMNRWLSNDPSGAAAWIQNSTLPDDVKQRLASLRPGG